jgi:HK97 family phage portal protein
VNFFPLTPSGVVVKIDANLRKTYEYTVPGTNRKITYDAADIIDIPFMLREDQLTHISPIIANKEALGLAIAATKYGAKVFQNGGIPPLVLQGAFASMESAERGSNDLHKAMAKAYKQGRQAIALPHGFEAKQLGFNPSEMQLVELQRWCVEQIARVYSLPPTFLQDLTHGTQSNTEQQDLHFVKHTLSRWLRQIEQELNLKLIGRGRRNRYIKFSVDGLLRGDYKTRMEGNAKAITTGQLTPNEARALEDREALTGGDELYIQGALMPTKTQKDAAAGSQPAVDKGDGGAPEE